MASRSDYHEEQFLRRVFDSMYTAPDSIQNLYKNTPRRVKWLILSLIAAAIMIFAMIQLAIAGVDAAKWANRTPLMERLNAPYELDTKIAPLIEISDEMTLEERENLKRDLPIIALSTVEDVRAALAEEQEIEPEAVLEEEITAAVRPDPEEFTEEYFRVLPIMQGYDRDFITDIPVHPTLNCYVNVNEETGTGCGMTYAPVFFEAIDYTATSNADVQVRVMAAAYETREQANEAIFELHGNSRRQGNTGNYSLLASQPVNYYYASADGWVTFTWSHHNWVFMASAQSVRQIETLIANFPY